MRRRAPLTSSPTTLRAMRERGARRYEERLRAEGRRVRRLRRRGVMERHKDDDDRYGPVWIYVRAMPCAGLEWIEGHTCGLGVRPATAHHLGRRDSDGLLPCCGALHDDCHERPWEVERALSASGSPDLATLGDEYVTRAHEEGVL